MGGGVNSSVTASYRLSLPPGLPAEGQSFGRIASLTVGPTVLQFVRSILSELLILSTPLRLSNWVFWCRQRYHERCNEAREGRETVPTDPFQDGDPSFALVADNLLNAVGQDCRGDTICLFPRPQRGTVYSETQGYDSLAMSDGSALGTLAFGERTPNAGYHYRDASECQEAWTESGKRRMRSCAL